MRSPMLLMTMILLLVVSSFSVALAVEPANDAFQSTWERTDQPVSSGDVARTWMWGPEAFTEALQEPYVESPNGERTVQYFDKARMEITAPDEDPNSIWYVTNGLLVVELITGRMQVGNDEFTDRSPADVNVAGDAGDPDGPTYATFDELLDATPSEEGSIIEQVVGRDGNVSDEESVGEQGVTVAVVDEVTDHAIAAPFWEFMNATGAVLENGQLIEADLFENTYFATGRPITEPYWANVQVGGTDRLVLLQCFERRCLTLTPDNPEGWQVEAGNVGQHYYDWRYEGDEEPEPAPEPDPDPTPEPEPEPTPGDEAFGDGIWIVGEDIEPGIYRNSDSSDVCYWARLSGLSDEIDDIIANDISSAHQIVEIEVSDMAFESNRCGTWSTDLTPITSSPTDDFGDGTYFIEDEVAPGLWRNSDSSESCYWVRLNGFGGTLDDIEANDFSDVRQVVEISPSDAGFQASRCGTWTFEPGAITTSPTADVGDGTYIVGVDIQAGVWQTESTPEGCYWARLDGFSGTLSDIAENEFIGEDDASASPQTVTVSSSDAGFVTEGCGVWTLSGM